MELGIVLITLAFICCVFDIAILLSRNRTNRSDFFSQLFSSAGCISIFLSLGLLLHFILTNDFSYKYVVEHSSVGLSIGLKLSTLWSGQEGSFLLWTAMIFLCYFIFRRIFHRHLDEKVIQRSFIVASFVCLAFAILTIICNPFARVDAVPLDGWGLNPLLRTVWNIVHPPVVFVSYATSIIPFSIVIALMTQRGISRDSYFEKKIYDFLNLLMAVIWLFLTLGIIIGGYWAYVTLGWGGYWAWDPVETTSLIAWLFCTVYFHGKGVLDRRGLSSYSLIFLTYISVIFAAFVTRSGVLSSVHGFSESPVTAGILLLMFGSVFTFVTLVGYQLSSHSLTFDGIKKKLFESNLLLAMFFSMICLLGITLVCYIGLLYPLVLSTITGQLFSIDPEFFNRFSFPFTIGLTVTVFFCTFPNPKHNQKLITVIGAAIGFGLLLTYLGIPTTSLLANFLIPITGFALVCVGSRVVRDFLKNIKKRTLLKSSPHTVLHFGLVLILLGVLLSSNTQITAQGWYMYHPEGQMECCNITIENILLEIHDIRIVYSDPYSYKINGLILAYENGELTGGGIASHAVEQGWGASCEELIITNVWRDIYVSLHDIQMNPITREISYVYLEIQIINFVSLVWAGCIITLFATLTLLLSSIFRFDKYRRKTSNMRTEN